MSRKPALRSNSLRRPAHGLSLTAAFVALAGVALVPAAADAALRASDLSVVPGVEPANMTGADAVGDVNGDGKVDIAVTVADQTRTPRSRVFVVFGGAGAPPARLDQLGDRGYVITVADETISTQPAGDFDGDGRADLLVSAPSGQYVLYGKSGSAPLDVQLNSSQTTRVGASGNAGSRAIQAAGDFNGDGADDLLASVSQGNKTIVNANSVVFGGPRVPSIDPASGPRTLGIIGQQTCRPVWPHWLYLWMQTCERNPRTVVPIGDFDGDGRDDLTISNPSQLVFGRAGLGGTYNPSAPTPAGSGIPLSGPYAPVDGVPLQSDGDLDGDGKAELVRPSSAPIPSSQQVAIRGRSGLTSLDTTTQPTIPYAGVPAIDGIPSSSITRSHPLGDFDGNGSTDDRLLPWWGYGTDVPTGSTTPSPYAGAIVFATSDRPDRVAPQIEPRGVTARYFTRVEPDPNDVRSDSFFAVLIYEPVKLELAFQKVGGLPVGTITRDAKPDLPTSGGRLGGAKVPFDGTVNGTALAPGDYVVDLTPIDAAGNRGETQDLAFTIKTPTTPGPTTPVPTTPSVPKTPVGALSAFTTQKNASKQADGSITLTPAKANVGGQAYWPTAVDLRNSTVEFDLSMTGGTAGGVGMTLAYTLAPPVSPVVPGIGSTLGFGGTKQHGIAVAFVTTRASKLDPGSNFVGVTHGIRPQASPTSMTYVQSADPGYSLRDRTVHVKSTIRNGNALTVEVDGKKLIDVPAGLYVQSWLGNSTEIHGQTYRGNILQFTASTGPANFQQHLVKNLKVTYD